LIHAACLAANHYMTDTPAAAPRPVSRPTKDRGNEALGKRALHFAIQAALIVSGSIAGLLLIIVISAALALAVAYPNLPDTSSLTDYRPKLPLRIFSADGLMLGEFGEEKRTFTPIGQIPKAMKDAVLAIEDANFYKHSGVDYKGVLRAGLAQFSEARSQGASTITMQLARNFYLSTEKTFTRKVYEVLLAFKIESQLEKDQILEVYMNQIFLGRRAYGFAAASEVYFGKPLKSVSIAEAAMLAGLPKAPSAYNPLVNRERATIRQRHIIQRMLENGYITAAERDQALAETLKYNTAAEQSSQGAYLAEMARQLMFAQYGEAAYTRGLQVQLTIHSEEQNAAYRALRAGLMDYERRQHYRGPEGFVNLPAKLEVLDTRVAEALADYPDNDELKAAVVLEASPRQVKAMLQNGETITVTSTGLRPVTSGLSESATSKVQIRRGAIVRAMKDSKGIWLLTQVPEVEGAFVSMDPRTGAIRALVGGFDFSKSKFNHVTQAWRQPGSTFKPFIFSAALEKGLTPRTIVNDAPLFFDADQTGSQPWEPKNYDGQFAGHMSLKQALAKSKNMVSIRVLQATGAENAQQWLGRFGFDPERHPPYLTMALGAGSVTPLQMATGFSVFANGGHLVPPMLIARVLDDRGQVLVHPRPPSLDDSNRVIDRRNAFVIGTLLQEVTRSGTAAKAQPALRRSDLYGKTGTTNESMDAWFAGYQPNLVAVVWIGYDTPRKLGSNETGGGLALPVWIEYMQHALKGLKAVEPQPPEGLVRVGDDWVYDEFTDGRGITGLGLNDPILPKATTSEERNSILDLFRQPR
jgi:penicillin-binding protein 1A